MIGWGGMPSCNDVNIVRRAPPPAVAGGLALRGAPPDDDYARAGLEVESAQTRGGGDADFPGRGVRDDDRPGGRRPRAEEGEEGCDEEEARTIGPRHGDSLGTQRRWSIPPPP